MIRAIGGVSMPLLLGIGALGALALAAIEKKKADNTKSTNTVGGGGPMSYEDTTVTTSEDPRGGSGGGLADIGDVASPVGSDGPGDESETPASGTGAHASTFGPTGVMIGQPNGPAPTTVFHRITPIAQYVGNTGTIGRTATANAYATTGVQLGAIW